MGISGILGMKRVMRILLSFLFVGVMAGGVMAEDRVRLTLQWYPQAQFAGYYIALEKGMYKAKGLDVEIIPGSADSRSFEALAKDETDFATAFLSDAMVARTKGVPVVNIAQIIQQSALLLVAKKESGITQISDLDGMEVGSWGDEFQVQPKALFKREGLDVTLIRQSPSFELFMRGGINVVLAMWYNEYHTLFSYGLDQEDMTIFFFSDLGLNLPEDGIYCLESTLENSPHIVEAFTQATIEGWEYVFDHPKESIDLILGIMQERKIKANRAHQNWMLARMKDIVLINDRKRMDVTLQEEDFDRASKALISTGEIKNKILYSDFFKKVGK